MRTLTTARVDPRPLAVARIGVGLATLVTVVEGAVFLARIHAGLIAVPVFGWWPEPTPPAVLGLLVVGVTAALALTVGLRPRAAAAVSFAVEVVIFCWDQQTYSNHRSLIVLLLAYLIFARSDAVWSVTRRLPRGSTVPYWPQFLMMTQLSACYLFAALSKVSIGFLSGQVLAASLSVPLPAPLTAVLSISAVLVEGFIAVALWVPRLRLWAALLGLGLHVSIVAMMTDHIVLAAFASACVPLYPLFLTRPSLRPADSPAPTGPFATAGV